MISQPAREPFGEYLGKEAVVSLAERRLLGGYQVRYLPFLWHAGFWVFLKGVVLGRALRDKPEVAATLLAEAGAQAKMAAGFAEVARQFLDDYGSFPTSFLDFWYKTLAPKGPDYSDLGALRRLYNRKERLGVMLPWLQMWCWEGVAFGITYPDRVETMWRANYETPNDQTWQQARAAGLDLPEQPQFLPLDEMECIVLKETCEYARTYCPELVDSLDI